MQNRPAKLSGPSYLATMEDGTEMHITINAMDGEPYEVFAVYHHEEYHEIVVLITRLASMALREGVPLRVVARELQDIHSPRTAHAIPGTNKRAPSLAARIGMVLEQHATNWKESAA